MRGDRVIDASALGAVTFGETRATEVVDLLRDARLFAPSLIAYELTSIARKKIGHRPDDAFVITRALDAALKMSGLEMSEVDPMGVLDLTRETGLTTYDASYLWLSRELGVDLVTLDEGLARASRA
jgi:predicted nucleic acid-binding protein